MPRLLRETSSARQRARSRPISSPPRTAPRESRVRENFPASPARPVVPRDQRPDRLRPSPAVHNCPASEVRVETRTRPSNIPRRAPCLAGRIAGTVLTPARIGPAHSPPPLCPPPDTARAPALHSVRRTPTLPALDLRRPSRNPGIEPESRPPFAHADGAPVHHRPGRPARSSRPQRLPQSRCPLDAPCHGGSEYGLV